MHFTLHFFLFRYVPNSSQNANTVIQFEGAQHVCIQTKIHLNILLSYFTLIIYSTYHSSQVGEEMMAGAGPRDRPSLWGLPTLQSSGLDSH